jgi:hypothetical protein
MYRESAGSVGELCDYMYIYSCTMSYHVCTMHHTVVNATCAMCKSSDVLGAQQHLPPARTVHRCDRGPLRDYTWCSLLLSLI